MRTSNKIYRVAWLAGHLPYHFGFSDVGKYERLWKCKVFTTDKLPMDKEKYIRDKKNKKRESLYLWREFGPDFVNKSIAKTYIKKLSKNKIYHVFVVSENRRSCV